MTLLNAHNHKHEVSGEYICVFFPFFYLGFSDTPSSINQKVFEVQEEVGIQAISSEEIGSIVINNITSKRSDSTEGESFIEHDLSEIISTNNANSTANETIRLRYETNVTYTISKTTV